MATRILEIGTGNGEGTVDLAKLLPDDGMLITIQTSPALTAQARRHIADAGFADRVSVIVAEPRRYLHKLRGPFDLIVQHDAGDGEQLHERLIGLLGAGGVLIRGGKKYSGKK